MTDKSEPTPKVKSDLRRILPGVLVSLLALVILLLVVDLDEFVSDLQKADFRYFPIVMGLLILSLVTRAYGWRAILQNKISVGRSFWTINEGYLLNNLLPLRLGEIGRAFLINQTTKVSFWEVLPTIVIERIFDVAFTAGMLLASLPFVIGVQRSEQTALLVIAVVVIGFMALFLSVRNKETILTWFDRLADRWEFLHKFGRERLASLLEGAAALSDAKQFLRVVFWMGLTWVLTIGLYYALLLAYVPDAKLVWATFSLGALAMGVAVPSSPAQIGVYEFAMATALSWVGVPFSLGLSYAVVAHAFFLLATLSLGAFALNRDGASIVDLYRQLRNRSGKL